MTEIANGRHAATMDFLVGFAMARFEQDPNVTISDVATTIQQSLSEIEISLADVTRMLSLSLAEKAHALYHGDWA